jgi:hypothetical protein
MTDDAKKRAKYLCDRIIEAADEVAKTLVNSQQEPSPAYGIKQRAEDIKTLIDGGGDASGGGSPQLPKSVVAKGRNELEGSPFKQL